jgi:hypothetical protein
MFSLSNMIKWQYLHEFKYELLDIISFLINIRGTIFVLNYKQLK